MKLRRHASARSFGSALITLGIILSGAIFGAYGCGAVDFLRRDPSAARDRASRFDRFVDEVTLDLRDTAPLIERLRLGESPENKSKHTWTKQRREAIRRSAAWQALRRLASDFAPDKFSGQRAVTSRILRRDLQRLLGLEGDEPIDRSAEMPAAAAFDEAQAVRFAVQKLAATPWSGQMIELPALLLTQHSAATLEDLSAWEQSLEELTEQASFLSASPAALAAVEAYEHPAFVLDEVIDFVVELDSSVGAGGARDAFFGPLLEAERALEVEPSGSGSTRSKRRTLQRRLKIEIDRLLQTLTELRSRLPGQTFNGSDALNAETSEAWSRRIREAAGPNSDPSALADVGRSETRRLSRAIGSLLDLDPGGPGFEGSLREKFIALRQRDVAPPGSQEAERAPETLWQNLTPQLSAIVQDCPPVLVTSRTARVFERPHGLWSPFVRGNLTPPTDPRARPSMFLAPRNRDRTTPAWLREAEALRYGVPGCAVVDAFRRAARTEVHRYLLLTERETFLEGWGLYALGTAAEEGLLVEHDGGFGRLTQELIVFVTLVADIGLNASGWTVEQAINYVVDNTPLPSSAAREIVTRITADPGRPALPAIGLLRLRSLREGVAALMEDEFVASEFHTALLTGGPLPMNEVDTRIVNWLDERDANGGR